MLTPFHLAIGVHDLAAARQFYHELLGCPIGRSSDQWIDFNFFGHQLVCHQVGTPTKIQGRNPVDGEAIPVPHFGIVLTLAEFAKFETSLSTKGCQFMIEPQVRFAGEAGEQRTLFIRDPSHNVLEFKAFANIDEELFKV